MTASTQISLPAKPHCANIFGNMVSAQVVCINQCTHSLGMVYRMCSPHGLGISRQTPTRRSSGNHHGSHPSVSGKQGQRLRAHQIQQVLQDIGWYNPENKRSVATGKKRGQQNRYQPLAGMHDHTVEPVTATVGPNPCCTSRAQPILLEESMLRDGLLLLCS